MKIGIVERPRPEWNQETDEPGHRKSKWSRGGEADEGFAIGLGVLA
jgi:hypothetical protein